MSIPAGTRLGPYEVVSPLGAGGMGEVYRARDTRLDRDVAIKVLPESVSNDPDRRARFEREAKAVAALSHPNILAIHDVGEQAGVTYAVTELLQGETLRVRQRRGPIPVRKAVDIAVQIARGLAAAHDRGVIHRDLKPENVFLLEDGQVKILDFGLARQTSTTAGSGASETVAAITDPGTVMGTVGYMAPEQVRGQAIDARTDLFALGAVFYEMLTGRRAFEGETSADTMTAILHEDPPPLGGVRPELVPALDRIIRHCLEKNRPERFQSARDIAFALEAFSGTNANAVSGAVGATPGLRKRVSWLLAGIGALAALAAGALGDRLLHRPQAPISFETKTWDQESIINARFAPDGQTIVYSAARDGVWPHLYAIRPGGMTPEPFGDAGTNLLAVSSKGELAVLTDLKGHDAPSAGGTLARMTIDGAPRPWLENVLQADWAPDGSTVAITRHTGGGVQLEYPVGHPLYGVKGGYLSDLRVSPDGSRIAFFEHQIVGDDRGWVKVIGATGAPRLLAGEYASLQGLAWSPDGRAIYFSARILGTEGQQPMVVNADGRPSPHQAIANAGRLFVHDVARDGRLLVASEDQRSIVRALLPGETDERDYPWLDVCYQGFLTRNKKFLVFGDQSQSAGANYAVGLRDLSTSRVTRLGEGAAMAPSPDGRWAPALIPSIEQVVLYPIGPGDPLRLPKAPIEHYQQLLQWFPDSKHVLLCGNESGKSPRCFRQDLVGGPPEPITEEGVTSALLGDDGRTMLLQMVDGSYALLTLGASLRTPAKGLTADDSPIAWTSNGRAVVVQALGVPAHLEQVDVTTGARESLRTIGPSNRPGTQDVLLNQWIDDGRGYTYTYVVRLSRLFVATGVGQ